MTGLNMKQDVFSEIDLTKQTDDKFFSLYDKYGASLYKIICMWVEDKTVAKEFLFKSFMQIHREVCKNEDIPEPVFNWMLEISRTVCRDLADQMGLHISHSLNPD